MFEFSLSSRESVLENSLSSRECVPEISLSSRESVPEIKNREKRTLGIVLLNDTIVLHVVLESMKLSFSGNLFLIVFLVNCFEKKNTIRTQRSSYVDLGEGRLVVGPSVLSGQLSQGKFLTICGGRGGKKTGNDCSFVHFD